MSIWDRVRVLEREMLGKAQTEHFHGEYQNIVTCEECGCAVVKGEEVKGEVDIRYRHVPEPGIDPWVIFHTWDDKPYIHTPVYCKRCASEKAKPKRSHKRKK